MVVKTIGGKEYTFEFSIEATLYNDVTESVMNAFIASGMAQNYASDGNVTSAMKSITSGMADVPQRAITMFYAGLLEHHGKNGDKTVTSINDAKRLIATYMKENHLSMYEVMGEMTEQMAEDNFFEMIGLDKMMEVMNNQTEQKPKRGRRKTNAGEN